MNSREQIPFVKHVPLSVLTKRMKHHTGLPEVVSHLLFIRLRYAGMSVVKAADTVEVSDQTGYNWQEHCNTKGFDGFVPCYAGGHSSRLTDDQKAELREKLREREYWVTHRDSTPDSVPIRRCLQRSDPAYPEIVWHALWETLSTGLPRTCQYVRVIPKNSRG